MPDTPSHELDIGRLKELAAKATPGPFDTMNGCLVRALRGDLAIPIFEPRVPMGPDEPAPTVRFAGKVQMRAGSHDARYHYAMGAERVNVELVALLLNALPAIIAALEAQSPDALAAAERRGIERAAELERCIIQERQDSADRYSAAMNEVNRYDALADSLRKSLEDVLNSSGARGRYHALEHADAVKRAEAALGVGG